MCAVMSPSKCAPTPATKTFDDNTVSSSAEVIPAKWATLAMPASGIIAEVLVNDGDTVTAGQVLIRLSGQEEVNALLPFLSRFPDTREMESHLAVLPVGQAYLCTNSYKPLNPNADAPIRFQVGPRAIPHIRHLQKYLRAPVPEYKRFYFCSPAGISLGITAANLWEFREMLKTIPLGSLHYHQSNGDFELWIKDVLGDSELARQVNKLDTGTIEGEALRQSLLELVIQRYNELDNLM